MNDRWPFLKRTVIDFAWSREVVVESLGIQILFRAAPPRYWDEIEQSSSRSWTAVLVMSAILDSQKFGRA